MSSIVIPVFKSTIGLVASKGRDKIAEILKDGDVTDQKFHSLIVKEIDEIKSKLDALSRKDLKASISFFKEGIALLYEVFKIANTRGECGAVKAQAACNEAIPLIEGIRRLEITGLDESATRKLSTAKKRFKGARKKATEAFNNESLETSDRILAMKYRVMATILETVDNPADALAPCRVCVEELTNSLPAVQNNFDVQLKTGIQAVRGWFSQEERREIISSVCHVNRVIYDFTRTFGGDAHFWTWPTVETGGNKINPLYDARVTKVLVQKRTEHCCVTPWSFGQEGEKEHELKSPIGIATNSSGEFIVWDWGDRCEKVFDRNGKLVKHFSLPIDDVNIESYRDVATDMNDNIFVLTVVVERSYKHFWWVYKLTKTAELHHKFRLRGKGWYRGLSVSDTRKVVTLTDFARGVAEYDSDGEFVRNFGKGILKFAKDITVANDGRVLVLDRDNDSFLSNFDREDFFVHIFSEQGYYLNKFKLKQRNYFVYTCITFHPAGEHVVVAGRELEGDLLEVKIYSKDGEFVRSIQIQCCHLLSEVPGITLNNDGLIAAVLNDGRCGEVVFL